MDTYAAWLTVLEPAGIGLLISAGFAVAGRLLWQLFGWVARV